MKKAIIPIAAAVLLLASCDTETKDSYQDIPYAEYNLIVDNADASQPAVATTSTYEMRFNISKGCVDVKTSDLIVNNQKVSFETDTMMPKNIIFDSTVNGETIKVSNMTFAKRGSVGVGSPVTDLSGKLVYCNWPNTTDLLNPDFKIAHRERLDMSYTYADHYSVQTLWPIALYTGQTVASEGGETYTTKGSNYLTQIDFEKKTASVHIYNQEFSADKEKALPQVIMLDQIPVVFTHDGFSLESAAPTTKVRAVKDNRYQLVDSAAFQAKDFSLFLTSSDLTEAVISYKLAGKDVNFRGCSILKPGL